jgi:hypothetical protein
MNANVCLSPYSPAAVFTWRFLLMRSVILEYVEINLNFQQALPALKEQYHRKIEWGFYPPVAWGRTNKQILAE